MFSIGKGKIGEATKLLFNLIIGGSIGFMVNEVFLQKYLGETILHEDAGKIFNLADLTSIVIGLFLFVGGLKMGKGLLRDIGMGWTAYAVFGEMNEWIIPSIRDMITEPSP